MNTLTFVHSNVHSFIDIYDDYAEGIKFNSNKNWLIDYKSKYISQGKKTFEKKILELIVKKNIKTIFFILNSEDLTFDIDFIKILEKHCFIVMNFFDTEYFFEGVDRHYSQFADLVLLPDYNMKFIYELYDIKAMCTFSLFGENKYKDIILNKDIDVSFVGDINKSNRRELIKYLKDNDINIEIYGQNSKNGIITFKKMIEIFNRTKINLNFTSYDFKACQSKDINQRIKQSKGRPIEIALCNGFCLSEEAPGIKHMFNLNNEIDIFTSKEELLEKIKFYLKNENDRVNKAKASFEKAKKNYTNIHGFKKIFDLIKTTRKSKKYYIKDAEFLNNYISFRYYFLTIAVLNLNFKCFIDELSILFKYKIFFGKSSFFYMRKGILDFLNKFPEVKNKLKHLFKEGVSK